MIKPVSAWKQDLCDPAIQYLDNKYSDSDEISLGQLYLDITDAGLSIYQVMFFAAFKDVPEVVRQLTKDTIINSVKAFLNVQNIYSYPKQGPYVKLKCIAMAVEECKVCQDFFYISTVLKGAKLQEYKTSLESLLGV